MRRCRILNVAEFYMYHPIFLICIKLPIRKRKTYILLHVTQNANAIHLQKGSLSNFVQVEAPGK